MIKGLLSIIVPVYNVENYLVDCIESILRQTYRKFELILVDDGSTDKCKYICDEYAAKDSRIKALHQRNAGQGAARNKGLDIARGEYISFIDSDDFIDENMYNVMIYTLEKTGSDISICGFVTHSGLRVIKSKTPNNLYIWSNSEKILQEYLEGRYITGNPWGKVFKRNIFDDIRFPIGVAREDVFIMHKVYGKCEKAVHVGECFYHYNIREGSSEHQRFSPKFLISIRIADERKMYIENNYPTLFSLAEKSCYGSRLSAIKKITRSHAIKENKTIYNELLEYIRINKAPTTEYSKLRFMILYLPVLYRIKMDFQYEWRRRLKIVLLKWTRTFKNGRD